MEVILLQHMENLGRRGQVVRVKPGYARNFLLPRGVAAMATAGAKRRVEQESRKFQAKDDKARSDAAEIATKLEALTLDLPVKADEEGKLYGSVSVATLFAALAGQGLDIDRKKIVLEHPIKELGEHAVHVKLHPDVRGTFKVNVARE